MSLFGIRYIEWERAEARVPYDQWLPYEYVDPYETFEEAKKYAERLQADDTPLEYDRDENGRVKYDSWGSAKYKKGTPRNRYLPYKLPPEQNYQEREAERIAKGEYEPLPAHMKVPGYDWLYARLIPATEKEPVMIGYYDGPSDARYDRLKKVKPTKFFSYFFSPTDMWDHMAELGLVKEGMTLAFVNTREDIRFIYEHGPESCMSGEAAQYFSGKVHPVEVYASPDLELAFLYRGEGDDWRCEDADDTVIVARALCNRNTKEYVRIYGDVDRMAKLLEEAGYSENQWAFGGCRLLKIYGVSSDGRENRRNIMLPYLDGACTEVSMKNDRDEFLHVIQRERILTGTTAGYVRI